MMVGHTKFALDWAFGLLKQRFKRTKVGCLADLAKVVTDSATINHSQLVGKENGEVIVKQFDWATFSAKHFRRQGFDGIKSLHHLEFAKATPGKVLVRMESDSEVQTLQVLAKSSLHWTPSSSEMLEQIIPAGLPLERSKYLYEKIREFVPVESRDIVCRNPRCHSPRCHTHLTCSLSTSFSTPSFTTTKSFTRITTTKSFSTTKEQKNSNFSL